MINDASFEFSYRVKEVLERVKTDIYDRGTDDRFDLGSPGHFKIKLQGSLWKQLLI